ncbi:DUF2505 domain-containing protein [Terrabacter sp. NPDC000476]|jgi:hypothetical protein|uniref:DUF2505 domain-containing protein n=1 Tax=Terrabacter sp. NPDC000476 TaxID=3154258 RepID=UPI003319CFC5
MKISETITYAAAPDAVYAMLTDPEFQGRKCVEAGALHHEAAVTPVAEGARVVTKRDLPADGLPDFARSVIGSTLTITETYEWGGPTADGSRDGTMTVEVSGAPVAMRGVIRIVATGAGTQVAVDGDLKASIPLFGGKVEKAATPAVVSSIRSERRTGTAWLAERA